MSLGVLTRWPAHAVSTIQLIDAKVVAKSLGERWTAGRRPFDMQDEDLIRLATTLDLRSWSAEARARRARGIQTLLTSIFKEWGGLTEGTDPRPT